MIDEVSLRTREQAYQLRVLRDEGAHAQTYEAVQRGTRRPVLVRRFHDLNARQRATLRLEIDALLCQSHPHNERLLDASPGALIEGNDAPAFIVLEHSIGESLRALLELRGALEPAQAVVLIRQACVGLGAMHARGVVHGDVRPGRLLVIELPHLAPQLEVTGYGLGGLRTERALKEAARGQALSPCSRYLAPEVIEGRAISPASDLYSLGVTLYECLCGAPLFEGEEAEALLALQLDPRRSDPRRRCPSLDEGLAAVVMGAMAPIPGERFSSMDAMIKALDRCVAPPWRGPVDAVPGAARRATEDPARATAATHHGAPPAGDRGEDEAQRFACQAPTRVVKLGDLAARVESSVPDASTFTRETQALTLVREQPEPARSFKRGASASLRGDAPLPPTLKAPDASVHPCDRTLMAGIYPPRALTPAADDREESAAPSWPRAIWLFCDDRTIPGDYAARLREAFPESQIETLSASDRVRVLAELRAEARALPDLVFFGAVHLISRGPLMQRLWENPTTRGVLLRATPSGQRDRMTHRSGVDVSLPVSARGSALRRDLQVLAPDRGDQAER